MGILNRAGIILILFTAACSYGFAAEEPDLDPGPLRQRLLHSVGVLPWKLKSGYNLEGRFILKATGEEINYKARYARSSTRWAADFSHENRSRNLRYVFSGKSGWISSPEITAEVDPSRLPYMAQFDFSQLYDELLRILDKGNRDPSFSISGIANEIHVSGSLQNGWRAIFVLNSVEYFPRKVRIAIDGTSSAAWLLPFVRPDGVCSLANVPGASAEFEIWLSDPVHADGYRYARRMDFAENGTVVGTFLLENTPSFSGLDALFDRPSQFPWSESMRFDPRAHLRRPSLYLNKSELQEFRSRIKQDPWSDWDSENRLIALWAALVPWIGWLFPPTVSLRLTVLAVAIGFLGFLFLLIRRRNQFQHVFPWKLLIAGAIVSGLIPVAGLASRQLHRPQHRGLIALHSAIRYAITGYSFYRGRSEALLLNFAREAPAESIDDLGNACQAYALAYDLIRADLQPARSEQIEKDLFNYAKPLYGASQGWISNTDKSSVLAAGLGMAGLAISHKPYVDAACEVMDKALNTQLIEGLHRSGPGQGVVALDSAVNLFYGLKRAGRADYYAHTAVQQYVRTALQMLSPVGTLPLFGDTNLDHSARLSAFLLKAADQLPEVEGRRCITAYNLYWLYGQHHAEGWIKWILPAVQPRIMFYKDPYVFLEYTSVLPAGSLVASSSVLGDGQLAVLRTGVDPESAYLSLNMSRSNSDASHRDILTFDLYAYRSLLLHGPGFPGRSHSQYAATTRTAASNSITLNQENQAANQCTGIESSLLNQPLFDHVRALADKTYDYGHVQRDIVMVRPEGSQPAYFLLLDDIFVSDPETTVQWHLHGRGNLATGVDQTSRWTSNDFSLPGLKSKHVNLEAFHPIGPPGLLTTKSGMLYSQASFLNQPSRSKTIEWVGSRRFFTILYPYKSGETAGKIESLGKDSCRIGATDWVSLGSLENRVTVSRLSHVSEYTIVRERGKSFPAFLMITGFECRFGPHSVFSTKPITASLNGLRGGFRNSRPDTRVEIRSPEIRAGDRFLLDGKPINAGESGVLIFTLDASGEHSFRHIS
jgi:hypothetical protein